MGFAGSLVALGSSSLRRVVAAVERGDGMHAVPWQVWSTAAGDAPPVTLDEARSLPGVGRGVAFVASVLAQLNPGAYRMDPVFGEVEVRPTPSLWQDPCPGWHPLPVWLAALAEDLRWHGNAFALIGTDSRQHRVQLLPLDAAAMSYDGGYVYRGADGRESRLPAHEVLHVATNVRPGRVMGSGILADYQHSLKLIRATESAQFVAMRHGVPTGIIKVEGQPTVPQLQAYKDSYLKSQRERSVAVMANASFQPINWTPQDLQMIPAREFNLRLAADITGVPPYLLGVPAESRVYSNQETEWTNFLRGSFGHMVAAIEASLSRVKPGDHVRFDLTELLRPDSSARWANYQTATSIGAMTVDEVRRAERMGPMPELAGDVVNDDEGA